jgi:NAD(P)-dependent dehydrogenase (short-subunit alcohol dehydrogenase family)
MKPWPGFLLDKPIHKLSEAQFDVVMKIHNYVPYRLCKALAPHWMDKNNLDMPKAIINISSVSGLHGAQGQVNYCTAKAGVLGLTMAMAKEWGRCVPQSDILLVLVVVCILLTLCACARTDSTCGATRSPTGGSTRV